MRIKIKKEWLGSRKHWLIVFFMFIAALLIILLKPMLITRSIESLYYSDGYETHSFSSAPIMKDLLPNYMAKKEPYGFSILKIKDKEVVKGIIFLCNQENSRESDIKCHANLPKYDTASCELFNHSDTSGGFIIMCFRENYAVSLMSMADLKQACVEMWDQANYFSEKYLDREFPSCELLDKVQEAQQQSKPSPVFGDLPA